MVKFIRGDSSLVPAEKVMCNSSPATVEKAYINVRNGDSRKGPLSFKMKQNIS